MAAPVKSPKKLNRENLIVSDIEASDWIKFLVIGIYDGETYQYFKKLDEYFSFIFSCRLKEIYFHFGGGYDFLFLIDHVFRNPDLYTIKEMIPRGSKFLSVTIAMKKSKRQIKLLDSSALLPFSLRSLCENFSVETMKGVIDYEAIKSVTQELLDYLKDDCKALHQVLSKFAENPLIKSVGIKQTIAGQAYAIYKNKFQKVDIERLNPSLDAFCRLAYQGGRTEIFKPVFDGPGKLKVFDINSLYPFAMKSFDYPIAFDHTTRVIEKNTLGIYHCKVEVPVSLKIPPLGIIQNGKYIFPTGIFSGYWTNAEITMAQKFGVKVLEVFHGVTFKNGGKIFSEYVDEIYNLRKKSASNSADNIIYKLLLNSLYGRFALNLDRQKIVIDDQSIGLTPFMKIKIDSHYVDLAYQDVELKSFTFSPIAIFVTSYARIYNYENYLSKYIVFYHDTDSFFIKDNLKSSNELGDIKLEYELDQACFLLPKTYLGVVNGKNTIKMKGFDKKKIQNFQFDDFISALEGDLKRLKSKTPRRIAKFRESIRRNKKVLSILNESDKNIRSKYDKRIFVKKGKSWDSIAHHLNEV